MCAQEFDLTAGTQPAAADGNMSAVPSLSTQNDAAFNFCTMSHAVQLHTSSCTYMPDTWTRDLLPHYFCLADHNNLTGALPEFLANSSLVELQASSNSLNGSLPESLGDVSSLVTLNLTFNDLTGSVPEFLYSENVASHQTLGIALMVSSLSLMIKPQCADADDG